MGKEYYMLRQANGRTVVTNAPLDANPNNIIYIPEERLTEAASQRTLTSWHQKIYPSIILSRFTRESRWVVRFSGVSCGQVWMLVYIIPERHCSDLKHLCQG